MAWWHRMLFPVRRAWFAASAKVHKAAAAGRKEGGGILKLHNDVQTCGYEDVQVMWEMMVRRSEKGLTLTPHRSSRRGNRRQLWRLPTWSGRTAPCRSVQPHHN